MPVITNIEDLKRIYERRVPRMFYDYAESGSWTITVTMPTGMTCLMASGQSYEALAEALPAPVDNDA